MGEQALFLSCGLGMLGLIVAAAGLLAVQPALRSARWPSTQGELLEGVRAGRPGDGSRLRYQYTVKGRTYTGTRLSFRGQDGLLARLVPGVNGAESRPTPAASTVTVYYDPAAPDRSVLRPGPGPLAYLPVAAGMLLFILGLLFSLLALPLG